MSHALARQRIVAIVEGAVPTSRVKGLGPRFKHDATVSSAVHGAGRHFGLITLDGARRGPHTLRANIARYTMSLMVDYPACDDVAAIDAAIVSDYESISAALADVSKWNGATSTIRLMGAEPTGSANDSLFLFAVEVVDGGRRLTITFPLEVTT